MKKNIVLFPTLFFLFLIVCQTVNLFFLLFSVSFIAVRYVCPFGLILYWHLTLLWEHRSIAFSPRTPSGNPKENSVVFPLASLELNRKVKIGLKYIML